ncbi:MAG: hypothetical protein FJZ15_00150 [Candidatus Omnitrophica bacterium]|nr:hypothetical protein [Candidatus Omnitrophota bacterium]
MAGLLRKERMRDLVFKNLISDEKKRRIISSSETMDENGVKSIIHRHFVYIVKDIADEGQAQKPLPYLYVLKSKDTKTHKEKFFCRIKGSVYAKNQGKPVMILFMHSLKISFAAESEGLLPKKDTP